MSEIKALSHSVLCHNYESNTAYIAAMITSGNQCRRLAGTMRKHDCEFVALKTEEVPQYMKDHGLTWEAE